MASLSSGCSAAVAIVVLLHLATINAELVILPAGDVQSIPTGTAIMLTCIANVENTKLISNMEWRDPYDRVVGPSKSKNKGGDNADMYTESQNGNLQLVLNSLKADQGGRYVCTATYANNESLSKSVKLETVVGRADPIENNSTNQDMISWFQAVNKFNQSLHCGVTNYNYYYNTTSSCEPISLSDTIFKWIGYFFSSLLGVLTIALVSLQVIIVYKNRDKKVTIVEATKKMLGTVEAVEEKQTWLNNIQNFY